MLLIHLSTILSFFSHSFIHLSLCLLIYLLLISYLLFFIYYLFIYNLSCQVSTVYTQRQQINSKQNFTEEIQCLTCSLFLGFQILVTTYTKRIQKRTHTKGDTWSYKVCERTKRDKPCHWCRALRVFYRSLGPRARREGGGGGGVWETVYVRGQADGLMETVRSVKVTN